MNSFSFKVTQRERGDDIEKEYMVYQQSVWTGRLMMEGNLVSPWARFARPKVEEEGQGLAVARLRLWQSGGLGRAWTALPSERL